MEEAQKVALKAKDEELDRMSAKATKVAKEVSILYLTQGRPERELKASEDKVSDLQFELEKLQGWYNKAVVECKDVVEEASGNIMS